MELLLQLLEKEFPNDIFETLPDYNIEYSENGKDFRFKIFKQLPKLFFAIRKEKKLLNKIILKHRIAGIISDNRPGIFSSKIPCNLPDTSSECFVWKYQLDFE